MKKLFKLIVCSTAIFALSSCNLFEDEKPSEETREVKTIVELHDSVKPKIVEQDAIMTELLNKVDTLAAEVKSTKAENAELKEKIAELKSTQRSWTYFSVSSFILGLIALIMTLLKSNGVKEEKVYDIVKKCLNDSSRIKELQVNVNQLLSKQRVGKTAQTPSSNSSNIDTRLHQLENQMAQVISDVNKITNPIPQPTPTIQNGNNKQSEPEYQKTGYAKNDMGTYFTTIYDSNQEGCVFKINFTSPNKGRFNIISLDKIQSRNDWQHKIECSGISIKEASEFRVEDEGICEKIDENTWQVTKPLKIRLLK